MTYPADEIAIELSEALAQLGELTILHGYQSPPFSRTEWFGLPLKFRRRWWRETGF